MFKSMMRKELMETLPVIASPGFLYALTLVMDVIAYQFGWDTGDVLSPTELVIGAAQRHGSFPMDDPLRIRDSARFGANAGGLVSRHLGVFDAFAAGASVGDFVEIVGWWRRLPGGHGAVLAGMRGDWVLASNGSASVSLGDDDVVRANDPDRGIALFGDISVRTAAGAVVCHAAVAACRAA